MDTQPSRSNSHTSTESSIFVASNRGPVTFRETGEAVRGSGGLVSALRPALEGGRGTWISVAMTDGDRQFAAHTDEARLVEADGASLRIRYLTIEDSTYRQAYDFISNSILWFAAHGLFDSSRQPLIDMRTHEAWDAYRRYNQTMAHAMASEIGDSDAVALIQDFHFYLVPGILKSLAPQARIAFFLHTPFPSGESFSRLPDTWREEILGLANACDLIGFHSQRWADRFNEAYEAQTGHDSARLPTAVFPLGPDSETLLAELSSESVQHAISNLDDVITEDTLLVLRVDRMEPAKNILRGFFAIDELLKSTPELRGRLVHMALLHPSRERLAEYQAYESECRICAGNINERWRSGNWEPIVLDIADSYPRSLAALSRYDVLLVNSIADGMNLVAREGPIVNRRDGVLVISENAGAADLLARGAIVVNPFDISATGAAIARAVSLSANERRVRATELKHAAAAHPPRQWLQSQLDFLGRKSRDDLIK